MKYFTIITLELTVLFIVISTLVALLLAYISRDRLASWLTKRGFGGNALGALAGSLTPFCACSTIPMTLGMLQAGAPFGSVMSFVIASPLLNPIIIVMLITLMDWKVALVYFIITFIGAVIYGYIPENLIIKIAGPRNLFSVPIAATLGIPLYIRAETAIPIGLGLMTKGMGLGTVIALIIGGSGMAIPEMSMLAGIFKKKLVGALVVGIWLTAVIGGYVFNALA